MDDRDFRILVDAALDYAIYLLDADGHITTWNKGAERLKGYQAAEVLGRHYAMFFTEPDRERGIAHAALERARTEGRCESEGWRVRKDGTQFWALAVLDAVRSDAGQCVGFAKVTRDMTERRMAQERLLESERRFGLLVRSVTDYAIFMLDLSGHVANWNAGAAKMKGYSADEIVGQHFSRFYTEMDKATDLPRRALLQAAQTGRFETEGWRLRKDGSRFWANVVIDAVYDEAGALVGFAKITRDITEQRAAQQDVEEMRGRLAQAQKLEALGQLTGGIAHDFNNLLQAILGGVLMAERRSQGNAAVAKILAEVRGAVGRGSDLTRQLLAFSRKSPVNRTVIDTGKRLRESANLFGRALRGDIGVEVRICDDIWPICVDDAQFELTLLNIAVNARDAMPSGGRIVVTAANRVLEGVPDGLSGRFVAIALRDSGTGIPAEVLSRVFEPFFTTKPIGRGTGLGLSQAYGFARQAGGTISISSDVGVGTELTLLIPAAADGDARRPPPVTDTKAIMHGNGARVLVVDDDAAVGHLAAEMLRSAGYRAVVTQDAETALQVLESGNAVDAVVSDVLMPGSMNGVALGREIRRRWPRLPILLATGYSGGADGVALEFPVIHKPYATFELAGALWPLLARRRTGPVEQPA